MSKSQYGFTPQTNTVDALMALNNFVQESTNDGQYAVAISLDVKGAFDAAWWPGILASLRNLRCPGNLYKLCVSCFNERTAFIAKNSGTGQRKISKSCPQGSTSGPEFWNILYDSLLNFECTKNIKGYVLMPKI